MAIRLRPGQKVREYEIVRLLHAGAFSLSYEARTSSERIFLKEYKSPSVKTPFYRGFLTHENEIKRRIENSRAKGFSYRFIDCFEFNCGHPCLFQAFEFIANGKDLREYFGTPYLSTWRQRVIFAKLIIAAVNALHEAKVVHTDLKPENIFLVQEPGIEAGYRLKVIDLDFSVLPDKRAPWHGHIGYIGSLNYFSPEHLMGNIPIPASDVFTAGLILNELLGQSGHPYCSESLDEYRKKVNDYSAPKIKLGGTMAPAKDAEVIDTLHRCLDPDPDRRPTAKEFENVLKGRPSEAASTVKTPPPVLNSPKAEKTPARPMPRPELTPGSLILEGPGGQSLKISIRTPLGKALCRRFGTDSQFLDLTQYVIERSGSQWIVIPQKGTANETLLNGKAITEPTKIKNSDIIAVGRVAKGITKLPMKVCIA